MGGRDVGCRLVVGLASLTLLTGCGAGASSTPTPAPTPATFGPVTVVTGTSRCPGGTDFVFTTDADGTKHLRDDYHADRCTLTTDDPRVSGSRSSTWSMDLWGRLGINHTLVQWGTQRLENDGGAWEGRATGVGDVTGRGDIIAHWYRGTGDYAGLSYFELWTGFEPWRIQGQIFPGDPPPPYAEEATGTERPVNGGPVADEAVAKVTGTHACPGMEPDWTTDPDGTMHFRDYAFECTDTTDDPRVSGTHAGSANMDVWGTLEQGAGVQWASVRLENAGGAWEGRAMGVASLPGRGDTIVIWYTGTDGYAGLSYFELITGSPPTLKIRGQIFPGDPPTP